ncbi:MAG: dienelactone hydrolase family protein [Bauldia sp.]|uniref:alpha/beta hydrolase family protein n=1 Tax=Bauldia sp. TaxID=2575872 RepID=UPI001D5B5CC6|nr:alpha/beta family hydrolase [Bauldia sp.]MCB1495136.1 dienelactone hydrolase family protein [Bauldia sp.]
MSKPVTIAVEGSGTVSGLFDRGAEARACLVIAHGAGAGMTHPFMAMVARGLAEAGIATLRFNFPYMEAKSRRPDRPPVAVATVRAAVAEAARLAPDLPLFAGGKSFGGRMTSTAQAEAPLAAVRGLVFFGFPLHPPGKPSDDRAAHLAGVAVPMLFLQGTRDTFAGLDLLEPLCRRLGGRATLHLFEDGDHSFHVRKASGRTDADVLGEMIATVAAWIDGLL